MLRRDVSLDGLKRRASTPSARAGRSTAKPMAIRARTRQAYWRSLPRAREDAGTAHLRGTWSSLGWQYRHRWARTALRCNASKVSILYSARARRCRQTMRRSRMRCRGGRHPVPRRPARGGCGARPREALRCQRMEWASRRSGRRRPVPVAGSEHDVVCNTIIAAIGQESTWRAPRSAASGWGHEWNTLEADPHTCQTGVPWVFATVTQCRARGVVDAIGAGARPPSHRPLPSFRHGLTDLSEFLSKKTNLPRSRPTTSPASRTSSARRCARPRRTIASALLEVDHDRARGSHRRRRAACVRSSRFHVRPERYAGEYGVDQTPSRARQEVRRRLAHPFIELDPTSASVRQVACGCAPT